MKNISSKALHSYTWQHGTCIFLAKNTLQVDELNFFSHEEKQRMILYIKEEDKRNFLVSHFLKRMLCASFFKTPPSTLTFTQNIWGKPHIAGQNQPLHFTLSHDSPWCAVAASPNYPLGLDIQTPFHLDKGALQKIIHPKDCIQPHDTLQLAQLWCIKEAAVKALGMGLHYPLHEVCIRKTKQNSSYFAQLKEQTFHVKFWTFDNATHMALASPHTQKITFNLII